MLRSFRVSNHRSLRDEAELVLLPAYDRTRPAVPVAGVFGANASGKSNLIDALRWLQRAARESYAYWEPGTGVPRTPFRLDPAIAAEPSRYCVEIVVDGSRYTYGLEVDDERVISEWLYTYPRGRKRVIFERQDGAIRLGSTVSEYRTRGDQLTRQTRDNALLLSVAAQNNLVEVLRAYHWFRRDVTVVTTAEVREGQLLERLADGRRHAALIAHISEAALGINDVTIARDGAELRTIEERAASLTHEMAGLRNELAVLNRTAPRTGHDPGMESARRELSRRLAEAVEIDVRYGELIQRLSSRSRLRFHHGTDHVPLTLDEQSAGTRGWIGLLSAALAPLDAGGLLAVDEIDASLHPHLTARLINLFRDAGTNPGGAQLLFTTHDPTLLEEDTLARDEVWFVEKDLDSGATRLFPLTDFHPRKHENRVGRYLAGSYGAIPIVSDHELRQAMRSSRDDDAAA